MVGKIYAFVPVGKADAGKLYVRIGWVETAARAWKRKHGGLNRVGVILLEAVVPDAKEAASKLQSILRGNISFGPDRRRLGGWHDGSLCEKTAFGNYWFETVYDLPKLEEIFRGIEWEFGARPERPERERPEGSEGERPAASAVMEVEVEVEGSGVVQVARVQVVGDELLIGPVSSAFAAAALCGVPQGTSEVC